MTRIIAGTAGGRRIKVPPAGTRPTSDRVREAVFSILASRIDFDGKAVLDLYAGSGALGLEALSRGASHVRLVESDARAARIAAANVADLGLPGAVVTRNTVAGFLSGSTTQSYDLVFADPPYDLPGATVTENLVALRAWLADEATVVIERSARSPATMWPETYEPIRTKDYGETRIEIGTPVAVG